MCAAKQSTLFQTWGKKETRPTVKVNVRPNVSGYSNTGGEVIELSDGEDDGEDALLAQALEESLLSAQVTGNVQRQCPQIEHQHSLSEQSTSGMDNGVHVFGPPDSDGDIHGQPSLSQIDDLAGFDKTAGRIWIYPTNYPVREYQFNIVSKALYKNTLVTLPTGLGKTFIAAVLMYNFYRWYPQGKVVFMAPTKPLVAQQIEACFNIMGIPQEDTAEMTGTMAPTERLKAWNYKRVFFLTPQVLTNDLSRGACPSADMRCLVVDEAHKALGNHAYCQVVRELVKYTREFRVLALSATPGSDIKAVQQVVANLLISHIELRSEESIDIQPYVHERKVTKIVVPLGPELSVIKEKYIRVMDVIVKRLTRQRVLYNRQTTSLSKFMILKSREAFRQNPPPELQRSQYGVIEGDFAIAMSLYHGFELLQQHGLKSLYSYLESLVSGDKGYGRTRTELTRNGDFREIMDQLQQQFGHLTGDGKALQPFALSQRQTPNQAFVSGHPKMDKLREIVLEHFNKYHEQGLGSTRIMIFSQYRDSVSEITDMLSRHRPVVKVMSFIGQSSAGKSTKGFTQKEQLKVMKKFREGGYNTLVSTCVGEEGLDIGDVDLIVCFDASKSPIRLVQRMGRTGRKRQGNIVMLMAEGKEEQVYNQSQFSKKSIHKAILNGSRTLQFYPHSQRMVPQNLQPYCHKMHITVQKAFVSTVKGRPSKSGMKSTNISRLFEQTGKATTKSDGTLNEAELRYWTEHFQLPQEQIPLMPQPNFQSFKKKGEKQTIHAAEQSHPKGPMLRLSEWMPWQNRKHSTMLMDHSLKTTHLVEMMEFIDLQQMLAEDDDSYGTEMTAFMNRDLILGPHKDSVDTEGISKFCTSVAQKDEMFQNVKSKTSRLICLPSLDMDSACSNSDEDLPPFLKNSSVQETEKRTKPKRYDRKNKKAKDSKINFGKNKNLTKKSKLKERFGNGLDVSRAKGKKKRDINEGRAVIEIIQNECDDNEDFDVPTDTVPMETNTTYSTSKINFNHNQLSSSNDDIVNEDEKNLEKYNLSQLLPDFKSFGKGLNSPSFHQGSFERSDKNVTTPEHRLYLSDSCSSPSYQVDSPPPLEELENVFSNIDNPKAFSGIDLLELVDEWEKEKLIKKHKNDCELEAEINYVSLNRHGSSFNPFKRQKVSVSKDSVCASSRSNSLNEDSLIKEKEAVCLQGKLQCVTENLESQEKINDDVHIFSNVKPRTLSFQGDYIDEEMECDDSVAKGGQILPDLPNSQKHSSCAKEVKTCKVLPQSQPVIYSSPPLLDLTTDILEDLCYTDNLGDDSVFLSQGFSVLEASKTINKCGKTETNNMTSVKQDTVHYPESSDKMAEVSMDMFEDPETVEDYGAFDLELSDCEHRDENKDGLLDQGDEGNDVNRSPQKDSYRKHGDQSVTKGKDLAYCNLQLTDTNICEKALKKGSLPVSPVINTHLPFRAYSKPSVSATPVARVSPFSESQVTETATDSFEDRDKMFLSDLKTPSSVCQDGRSSEMTPGKVSSGLLDESQFTFTQALDCLHGSQTPSRTQTPRPNKGQDPQRSHVECFESTTPSLRVKTSGEIQNSINNQHNQDLPSTPVTTSSNRVGEVLNASNNLQSVTPTESTNNADLFSPNDECVVNTSSRPTDYLSTNPTNARPTSRPVQSEVSCDQSMALFQDSDSDSNDRPQFDLEYMWEDVDVIPPSPVHDQSVAHKSMSKCSQSLVFGKKRMSSIPKTTCMFDQHADLSEQNSFPEESMIFPAPNNKALCKMNEESTVLEGLQSAKEKYFVKSMVPHPKICDESTSDSVIFHRPHHIQSNYVPEDSAVFPVSQNLTLDIEIEDSVVFRAPRSKTIRKKLDISSDLDELESDQLDSVVKSKASDSKDWDMLLKDSEITSPKKTPFGKADLPTSPVFTPPVSNTRAVRLSHGDVEESSDSDDNICYRRRKSSKIALLTSPHTPSDEDKTTPLKHVGFKRPQICERVLSRSTYENIRFSTESKDSPVLSHKRFKSQEGGTKKTSAVGNISYSDDEDDFADMSIKHSYPKKADRHPVGRKNNKKRSTAACQFIDNEAELSEEGASDISDDEMDCSQLDEALAGFINDGSQMTQHQDHDEEAMYLRSVKSPLAADRDGVYRQDRPSALEVCSQFSPRDYSEYLEDSFCVDGEEEEILDLGEISCFYPASKKSKIRKKGSKRTRVEEKRSRVVSGRKRVIVQDGSSSDEWTGPHIEVSVFSSGGSGKRPAQRARVLSSSDEESILETIVLSSNHDATNQPVGETRHIQTAADVSPPLLSLRSRLDKKRGSDVTGDHLQEEVKLKTNCDKPNEDGKLLSRSLIKTSQLPVTASSPIDSENLYAGHVPKLKTSDQLREERLKKQKEKQEEFRKTMMKKQEVDKTLKTYSVEESGVSDVSNVTEFERNELSINQPNFTHLFDRRAKIGLPSESSLLTTPLNSKVEEEKKVVIFVDSREITGGQEVVSHLRVSNEFRVSVRQLTGCDYILSNRLGVERKQWSDFANGSNRNKLQERIQLMCALFDRQCLIIEKDRVKVGQEKSSKPQVKTKYVETALAWLSQSTVRVFHTDSQEETATLLSDLCKLESRKGMGIQLGLDLNKHQEQMLKFYSSLPALSYVTALNLCHSFKNLKEFCTSCVKTVQVRGHISESRAGDLKDFLQHEFCLTMVPSSKQ